MAVALIGGAGSPIRASAAPEPPHAAATRATSRAAASRGRMGGASGGSRRGYPAVAVPVMFVWMVQMKVYCPAGRAGTS